MSPLSSHRAPVLGFLAVACSTPGATSSSAGDGRGNPSETAVVTASASSVPPALSSTVTPSAATRPPARGCVGDGCWHEVDSDVCLVDERPPSLRYHPPETTFTCACIEGTCQRAPLERIPCKTVRDCWIDPSPRTHPIARPPAFRGRDFAPCKDGEIAPSCGTDGFCAIGPAYKC